MGSCTYPFSSASIFAPLLAPTPVFLFSRFFFFLVLLSSSFFTIPSSTPALSLVVLSACSFFLFPLPHPPLVFLLLLFCFPLSQWNGRACSRGGSLLFVGRWGCVSLVVVLGGLSRGRGVKSRMPRRGGHLDGTRHGKYILFNASWRLLLVAWK
ncbi:hypothetical protein DFJ73DRAFT_140922 [Zopfochytrium polystomum]|nr:hypothetical protein DFJ73DRAFT_140922 [Zopfochytrium polystomum]